MRALGVLGVLVGVLVSGCVSRSTGETEVGVLVCKIGLGCRDGKGVQRDLYPPGSTSFVAPCCCTPDAQWRTAVTRRNAATSRKATTSRKAGARRETRARRPGLGQARGFWPPEVRTRLVDAMLG